MQYDAGRIQQMSEDLLGVMDVAEQLMQTTFTNLCNALCERDHEIDRLRDETQRLRKHIANLEAVLTQRHTAHEQRESLSAEFQPPDVTIGV